MRFCLVPRPALIALGATAAMLLALPARAYSPTDPKVQAIVGKARTYLASADVNGMGEKAVIALALIKSGSDASDPKVQEAVAAIRQGLKEEGRLGTPINYHVAISVIFLLELDPLTYRAEIQSLLDILLRRQEQHGGWSYWPGEGGGHSRSEGDSSMTQYGTLALWGAKKAKFDVPQEACERVANFWIRTQTPAGTWGYQGHPAPLGQRAQQQDVRPSIVLAALSSCYVIGDLFGMARDETEKPAISSALQKVRQPSTMSSRFTPQNLDLGLLRQTMAMGDRYVAQMHRGYQNATGPHTWTQTYYMYAMERYRSFQDHYQAQDPKVAKWYDDGVEFLEKMQKDDGSWTFGRLAHHETPFAILFLMRSTKKSIEREFGDGLVRGGRGLPSDISKVAIDEATGDVINPEALSTVESLITILDDPNNANLMALAASPAKLDALVRPKVDEEEAARQERIQK
ncbi:MAG: hypothetical protein KY475_08860, partial [Planctomycetes bacterium]|nr:hypothetical protein [Planctomycetota bacterium]